jgi:hypothetical protein
LASRMPSKSSMLLLVLPQVWMRKPCSVSA